MRVKGRCSLRLGVGQTNALAVGYGVEHEESRHAVESSWTFEESERQAAAMRFVNGICGLSVAQSSRRPSVGQPSAPVADHGADREDSSDQCVVGETVCRNIVRGLELRTCETVVHCEQAAATGLTRHLVCM